MAELASGTSREPVQGQVWIGLDVGGTKIDAVAVDGQGQTRGHVRAPTDASSAEHSVASIVQAIEAVMDAAEVAPNQVAAIGVGIPGMVHAGEVSLAVNLNLSSFPLAGYLTGRFGIPVVLENDVRSAALGAYTWLHQQWPALKNIVYLSIGTGISCGVILDGRLHRGVNGLAGEIGHTISDPNGEVCKCGSRGCLETIASGPAIARFAGQMAGREPGTRLHELQPLTAEDVFAAAREGDPLARAVVQRAAAAIARTIYNLLLTYDVDLMAVGGGVSQAGAVFMDPVNAELQRIAANSPLASQILSPAGSPAFPDSKVMLLPSDAVPAWYGVIVLAKGFDL